MGCEFSVGEEFYCSIASNMQYTVKTTDCVYKRTVRNDSIDVGFATELRTVTTTPHVAIGCNAVLSI